jgi:dihydroorotase
MKTLITNVKTLGKYLGQAEELVSAELLIENDVIKTLATKVEETADQTIDGQGLFLSPGLIDPQVHFREPGLEYKEDIESGSKTAAKGGFTTVISMPNTSPTADNPETVKYMFDKQEQVGLCRVLPTGAVTYGLKGEEVTEFTSLKEAGAVALTDDGKGIQKEEVFKQAMERAAKLDLAILDHSEDESLSAGGAIHLGAISEKHGVKGIKAESEAVHVERGCRLSGETGCHYHVLHISTAKSINYVREAKKNGYKVTAEVSPHHLLLCDEDIPVKADGSLDANWKMNPPLRSKEDRLACIEALMDGTIDAVATDHAPHAPHEKDKEIHEAPFGIIGLETAFPLMYTHFVKNGQMSLERLVYLMSEGGAKLFKLPYGTLNAGESADITLLDLSDAQEVTADGFASKSKNSPFIGQKLFGHAKLTVYRGKVVYSAL